MGHQEDGSQQGETGIFGEHRLATKTIEIPPERQEIERLQAERPNAAYHGFDAVNEADELGLLRSITRHAEVSSTYKCPEDCGGCPDRVSLHRSDQKEKQMTLEDAEGTIDKLRELGVEYFLLIGGTIDGHSYTPKLMRYILDKGGATDVGWFTDGIMLLNPHTGKVNPLFEKLVSEGGLLDLTTHVSADYLVDAGARGEGAILDPSIRWESHHGGSRFYKSAFSERLARTLIEKGARRVILNTAISAHNIDQVIPVYNFVGLLQEYAREINSPTAVLFTFSPWVWRPHLARGDDPRNYDASTFLNHSHVSLLSEISRYILGDTQRRIDGNRPRIAANSSGFIAGFPDFAVTQDVSYINGSSEFAVQPNGVVRIDPLFVSPKILLVARNPYGYRDRDLDNNPFDQYNGKINDPIFSNLIQTTRGEVAWR